jgi:two-component system chemotaxis response regulator CheY
MEGVDGITCLREIMRADPQARVIMISAQGSGQLEKESLDAGARGYVAKPIDLERLQAEIEKALAD